MQHPVGYTFNEATNRAELTSIFKVLTNSTTLLAFPHTILAAWATAGTLILAVCAYHMLKGRDVEFFSKSAKVVIPFVIFGSVATMIVGHFDAQLMTKQQPMKMAAAEALKEDESGCVGMSIFAVGPLERSPQEITTNIKVPCVLGLMAHNSFDTTVRGANSIAAEYAAKYGGKPDDYVPWMGVTYWMFRAMMGAGILIALLSITALFKLRKGTLHESTKLLKLLVAAAALPFIANSAGWIFAEMGRQPWVVFGLFKTSQANSPTVSSAMVLTTLIGYTLIYTILGVVGAKLWMKEAKHGPDDEILPAPPDRPDLVLTY